MQTIYPVVRASHRLRQTVEALPQPAELGAHSCERTAGGKDRRQPRDDELVPPEHLTGAGDGAWSFSWLPQHGRHARIGSPFSACRFFSDLWPLLALQLFTTCGQRADRVSAVAVLDAMRSRELGELGRFHGAEYFVTRYGRFLAALVPALPGPPAEIGHCPTPRPDRRHRSRTLRAPVPAVAR